jgi:RES domain-containing protein
MQYGKQWIDEQLSPILRVPSVHSPWEYNFLINPQHPELDIEIVDQTYYLYDNRFIREG